VVQGIGSGEACAGLDNVSSPQQWERKEGIRVYPPGSVIDFGWGEGNVCHVGPQDQ
jgi:hypothetical protein